MKKLSFLLIAFALVAFISLNACKSSTKPAESTETEEVVDEAEEEMAPDTAVVAEEAEEMPAEEAAE